MDQLIMPSLNCTAGSRSNHITAGAERQPKRDPAMSVLREFVLIPAASQTVIDIRNLSLILSARVRRPFRDLRA